MEQTTVSSLIIALEYFRPQTVSHRSVAALIFTGIKRVVIDVYCRLCGTQMDKSKYTCSIIELL